MKKLYRDINNKMIGGVLAGFASYFNAEVTLLRAAYTILTVSLFVGEVELFDINIGGALFLLYLILWLIMPKEMKGTA
ncbi:MAG: PspC domain-containing protein [Bacteroidales bacterium]|nr:PspC domain-containing protein [Bacteroidales bacterium]